VTNCSNNYGPYQFPEKLIPLTILNAVEGRPVPIYGDGLQVRDWLHVDDHVRGLLRVLESGRPGATYNVGANCEKTNLAVVDCVLGQVALQTGQDQNRLLKLKRHVADRPAHDRRYAIDATKIRAELGWQPQQSFDVGIGETVAWYLRNVDWCRQAKGMYAGERLGLKSA
jgi:dTDP-glucose 4,6-dehydratase